MRGALAVLGGGGRLLPIRLAPMEGDSITGHPAAFGAVVEPRGGGRVALYWLGAGQRENEQGKPWRIETEMLSDRMARAGWLVEAGRGRRVVMAWRPPEQAPVETAAEIEQAPRCTACTGKGCHWCYWTGEQQPSELPLDRRRRPGAPPDRRE
ncbi:hypothetical protein AB0K43_11225 [Kitasatospora sp. NPDC049258]|uniref:hypothetical protein n=1 Tax=Kitasatospora sp. NPDC049258 TaxID=3155394 RepID=UPI00343D4BF3